VPDPGGAPPNELRRERQMTAKPDAIYSLLGDLSDVPQDYIRDVAHTKRFLERWTADPSYRDEFARDPSGAIASLGLSLSPDQVDPLTGTTDPEPDDLPVSVLRYRAYTSEKLASRDEMRKAGESAHPRMAAWRRRQHKRCIGELGASRAEAIVHAPASFELSKGCTVGCWFCGISAPKFDNTWPYTTETAGLWRATLATLRDVIGPCIDQGFLYWATDPLDNPDYERFLTDFHDVLGRCPQTTTAQGQKDIERTRRLLRLSHAMGSSIDRFSIIALNSLNRIHEGFTPEELLRVECIPQNREAADYQRKAYAGRARKFAQKRKAELVEPEDASTIACVSGFLFNMIDRSVQLVTPCSANERWPLGYWVLDRGTFDTPAELRELLETMINSKMRAALRVDDKVLLRRDIAVRVEDGVLYADSRGLNTRIAGQTDPDDLAAMLADGGHTAGDIALRRENHAGVPLTTTLAILDSLFAEGLIDEEPPAPRPASAGPVDVPLLAKASR
jgi:radical SAM family RiPP maturation amino acid epimerase